MNDVAEALKPGDFATDQEVRWCPGCGDFAVLKAMRRTLSEIGATREHTVFVSGIGCAARLPYYMATYGFHTIHGRATAIATGVKLANPDLDVWVVSGDGDGLSIGGNHLLHLLRRNVDVQILLFNNETYGLTKGQYSPTSRAGTRSPSTPLGSVEHPLSAAVFAMGAGARFVARTVDTLQEHVPRVLAAAHAHHGASFVEILQNCIVYNDGVYDRFTSREVAADAQVHVEHGEPLRFGKDGRRGLRVKPGSLSLEAVTIGEGGVSESDLVVHDRTDRTLAALLAAMEPPMPVALGVLYCDPAPAYEAMVRSQIEEARSKAPDGGIAALLRGGRTWEVEGRPST